MKKTLYFNKDGYCMSRPSSKTIFQMKCLLPKGFVSKGVAIEDFITDPSFEIEDGCHIENDWLHKNKRAMTFIPASIMTENKDAFNLRIKETKNK